MGMKGEEAGRVSPVAVADLILAAVIAGRVTWAQLSSQASVRLASSDTGSEFQLDPALRDAVLARLALLARLDLAADELQSGRISARLPGRGAAEILMTLRPTPSGLSGELQRLPGRGPEEARSRRPVPAELPAGFEIGPYRVVGTLGHGGMGVVYEIEHRALARRMAMKVIRSDMDGAEDEIAAQFLREARAAAAIHHPGIVSVSDFGNLDDGRPYLVMDRIDGVTLAAYAGQRPIAPAVAVAIAREVAEALGAAHAAGVVHRDLKPQNIFLVGGAPDRIVLVDFGAAARTDEETMLDADGRIIGTPCYLAPEQVTAGPPDRRTDIYQLGIVLFEALTGDVPFDSGDLSDLLMQHLHKPPPPVRSEAYELPPGLEALVHRMLAKPLEARPQSTEELVAELDRISGRLGRVGWRRWLPR